MAATTGAERKAEVLEFISQHIIMSLSSLAEDGRPQAAIVGFGQTDKFEIIFGTLNTSRKYANLQRDSRVAAIIGWDKGKTVQYEGRARELSGEEAETYAELYFAKNPTARQFKDDPDERYFIIEPTWVRYTDITQKPWDMVLLEFEAK